MISREVLNQHFDEYYDNLGRRQRFFNNYVNPVCLNMAECSSVKSENNMKLSRSKIEIEDLGCDILSGVRIFALDRKVTYEPKSPSWPQIFWIHVGKDAWVDNEQGVFRLSIDSYTKEGDKIEPAKVWLPFMVGGITECEMIEADWVKSKGKKYKKLSQKFLVKMKEIEEDTPSVTYLQFLCRPKFVKYNGVEFKNGDIITIVVKHNKFPSNWPNPPVVTVIPTEEMHFVPMLPKQRMMIVTKTDTVSVDYKPHVNSTIDFEGIIEGDFGRECAWFHCKKPSPSSEIIFLNQKGKKEKRKIVVPLCEKEVRYPVILNPLKNSVIHAQNINGFTLRFFKDAYHPVMIASGTPLKIVTTNENAQYIERRFEIDKQRPFFYLRKQDYGWIIN